MREIKFRGKILKTSEWVYGYYVYTHDRHRIIYEDYKGFYCEEEVDPETVGQYTGLKDRNGTGIYEGDVIAVSSEIYTSFGRIPTGDYIEYYVKIIWMKDGWGYRVLKNEHTYGPVVGSETKGIDVVLKYGEVISSI